MPIEVPGARRPSPVAAVRHERLLSCKTYLKRLNVTQYMSDHLLPRHLSSKAIRMPPTKVRGHDSRAAGYLLVWGREGGGPVGRGSVGCRGGHVGRGSVGCRVHRPPYRSAGP